MELVLVRHAEATHQEQGLVGGWSNTDITSLGIWQAEKTGETLRQMIRGQFEFLSSDLLRAQKTSDILGQKLGHKACYHKELRELNNGEAADKTWAEAEKLRSPITSPAWDWVPFPNAESWRDMHRRIWSFLDATVKQNRVHLIVSHGNAMVEIVNWFLRLDLEGMNPAYEFENCSITVLGLNEWEERTIRKLNDTSHLSLSDHHSNRNMTR